MSFSTPDQCFIKDIDGGDKTYTFQFIPSSITDSKNANYADYAIQGRSSPLKGYQNSAPRILSFTVKMWAQPTQENDSPTPADIKADVDFLRSLTYPDYQGGLKPPHRCLVQIGENVRMYGVCKSVTVSYNANENVWDLGPGYAHGPSVSLVFEEIANTPLDTWDVRDGAYNM